MILGAVGLVVLLLVGGLVTWSTLSRQGERAPFDEAVDALAAAPGLHDQDATPDGSVRWDLRVTGRGESIGTVTSAGQSFGVLAVDGTTYLRTPDGATSIGGVPILPDMAGRWITGVDDALGPVRGRLKPPSALATDMRTALDQTWSLPSADDPPAEVDGVPALTAHTPSGDLSVSADAPHRVLRYTPRSSNPLGNELSLPAPGSFRSPAQGPDAPAEPELISMPAPAVTGAYDDLVAAVPALGQAVDAGIHFRIQGSPDISCDPGGCTVTATVGDTVSSSGPARVTGGSVTGSMTATVSVDGRPAGGCAQTSPLPLNGSGSLTCRDPAAGPVYTDADAEARERAEAAAEPGSVYTWSVPVLAPVEVVATAQIDVERLVGQLTDERGQTVCAPTPNSFPAGTPVLLADGSTRPIETLGPGDRVLATDPATGSTRAEPVLARIVGHRPEQFDTLTVTVDPGRTGTVTATANHPFWDPARRGWVAAGALRVGEHLRTAGGPDAVVTASRPFAATTTVDNLTVADVHTYYVVAGGVAVLVHNQDAGAPADRCDVWAHVSPTQGNYPGLRLPVSFDLDLGANGRYHVIDQVTEHIQEVQGSLLRRGVPPDLREYRLDSDLESLRNAVIEATRDGMPPSDSMVQAGGWELVFLTPRDPGNLPVIKHALPIR